MWCPSDPLPDVYPQLAKLSASLSGVVVKAELPASRSWFLLNGGQYALNQPLDSCVKTFMDKTPYCFSSAFCFWNFPDIAWTIRVLCVATAGWRAWGLGEINDTKRRGHRAWSWVFTVFVPIVLQVSRWGLWWLACGPGDCMRKGPMDWIFFFLGSPTVPSLRA